MTKKKAKVETVNPFEKHQGKRDKIGKGNRERRLNGDTIQIRKRRIQKFQLDSSSDTEYDYSTEYPVSGGTLGASISTVVTEERDLQEKTKKEIMEEVMNKSKHFKEQHKQERLLLENHISELDEEFKKVLPLLPKRKREDSFLSSMRNRVESNGVKQNLNNIRENVKTSLETDSRKAKASKEEKNARFEEDKTCEYLQSKPIPSVSNSRLSASHFEFNTMNREDKDTKELQNSVLGTKEKGGNSVTEFPRKLEEFIEQSRHMKRKELEECLESLTSPTSSLYTSQRLALRCIFVVLRNVSGSEVWVDTGDLQESLDLVGLLVGKSRFLVSSETNDVVEEFVETVKQDLGNFVDTASHPSEPNQLSPVEKNENRSHVGRDWKLFATLFLFSRLCPLKKNLVPETQQVIFLVSHYITRARLCCIHDLIKRLVLMHLFIPHIEAASCLVPEFFSYCSSVLGLFLEPSSPQRDTMTLDNVASAENIGKWMRTVLLSEVAHRRESNEQSKPLDILYKIYSCDGHSCNVALPVSNDDLTAFKLLDSAITLSIDMLSCFSRIFQNYVSFRGLFDPLMKGLEELRRKQTFSVWMNKFDKAYLQLSEIARQTEQKGWKPLQLYNQKVSIPKEYEPKLKSEAVKRKVQSMRKQVRNERRWTIKVLQAESRQQQHAKFQQHKIDEEYRNRRTEEALRFLQQQREDWNKQEKKWKNKKQKF